MLVHHGNVNIRALASRNFAAVLHIPVAEVRPDQRYLGWNLQVSLLHEAIAFLSQIGDKVRVGIAGANDLHLFSDGLADALTEEVVVVLSITHKFPWGRAFRRRPGRLYHQTGPTRRLSGTGS